MTTASMFPARCHHLYHIYHLSPNRYKMGLTTYDRYGVSIYYASSTSSRQQTRKTHCHCRGETKTDNVDSISSRSAVNMLPMYISPPSLYHLENFSCCLGKQKVLNTERNNMNSIRRFIDFVVCHLPPLDVSLRDEKLYSFAGAWELKMKSW